MPNPPSTGLPNPASYDTSGPSVVIDNVTHLMWQHPVGTGIYNWSDAKNYCQTLSVAGHQGWRLPTVIELYSLVDFTRTDPAIDPTAFPNTPADWFWTSSYVGGSPAYARGALLSLGYTWPDSPPAAYRVRCANSQGDVSDAATGRYTIQNNGEPEGTVTDNNTGLTWQQAAAAQTYNWSNAASYCANIAPGNAWRLPSVKEFMTLVDFSQASQGPMIDGTAFPNTDPDCFWSSSASVESPGHAWFLCFDGGFASDSYAVSKSLHVRCVR